MSFLKVMRRFNDCSDDEIINVFSFLPFVDVARCARLSAVSAQRTSAQLRRRTAVRIAHGPSYPLDIRMKRVFDRSPYIKRLVIVRNIQYSSMDGLQRVPQIFQLRELALGINTPLSISLLENLAVCVGVERLEVMRNCSLVVGWLSYNSSCFPKLRVLVVNGFCNALPKNGLAEKRPELKIVHTLQIIS